MIAKRALVLIAAAAFIWLFWQALAIRRGDPEQAKRDEDRAQALEDEASDESRMDREKADEVLAQYESLGIEWVGDALSPSIEADFLAVCPELKETIRGYTGEVGMYSCAVSMGLASVGGARILPISMSMRVPTATVEALVTAMEEKPDITVANFTVKEEYTDDASGSYSSLDLSLDMYTLAHPTDEDVACAQEAALFDFYDGSDGSQADGPEDGIGSDGADAAPDQSEFASSCPDQAAEQAEPAQAEPVGDGADRTGETAG